MQDDHDVKKERDVLSGGNISNERRKRINRMKTVLLLAFLVLLLLPSISCVILGIRVSRLQKQVSRLTVIQKQQETADNNRITAAKYEAKHTSKQKGKNYVYAAVKPETSVKKKTVVMKASAMKTSVKNASAKKASVMITSARNASVMKTSAKKATKISLALIPSSWISSGIPEKSTAFRLQTDSFGNNPFSAANDGNNRTEEKQSTTAKEGIYSGKQVFLTFDDGPSSNTDKILDILSKYQVKATFFVIGKTDPKSKKLYQRIVKEGHTLAIHSYSHNYEIIYKSLEDFEKDFTKLWKLLYDTTGYKPSIYRFPGGSINLENTGDVKDYVRYLKKKSIVYYDWNVVSGDATNRSYTEDQLVSNVLNGVAAKERSIVLMHDSQTKKSTADSLPKLIKALKSGGAQLLPLDQNVSPIQMIKSDSMK